MVREKRADEKFCAECGEIIRLKAEICPKCGCRQMSMSAEAGYSTTITINKGHSRTTAGLCALFLGGIGLHKFYLGKPIQGLFYVFFCWTFIPAFIALFEGIRYLMMSDAEFQSRLEQDKLDHIGGTFSVSGITPDTHVKCPDCRGFVPKEAKVCQHCNCKLVPQ